MEITDLLWTLSPELLWNLSLSELKASQRKASGQNAALIERLQQENYDLRLRLSLLIRLLIERGIFKADDFSALLAETKTKLAQASSKPGSKRTSPAVAAPKSLPRPPRPKLPVVKSL
jgi:hypothetical protein